MVAPADAAAKLPLQGGVYAWWVTPGQLPGIKGPRHVSGGRELLHVGAAPGRAGSSATLRQIIGHHLGTNIGNDFRFALAALLHEREGWSPVARGGLPRLSAEDAGRLREWQEKHLRLTWRVQPEPWLTEAALVETLAPPLNLAGPAVQRAGAALRAKAQANSPRLAYEPSRAAFVVGYDIHATPVTRKLTSRRSDLATAWLAAISAAARAAASTVRWSADWRFAAVVEIRIAGDADIDNFLKDTLDRSKDAGVFAGDDKRIDLVHGIKRAGVGVQEVGARVEVWRLAAPLNAPGAG
jgi:hypothetical protein